MKNHNKMTGYISIALVFFVALSILFMYLYFKTNARYNEYYHNEGVPSYQDNLSASQDFRNALAEIRNKNLEQPTPNKNITINCDSIKLAVNRSSCEYHNQIVNNVN